MSLGSELPRELRGFLFFGVSVRRCKKLVEHQLETKARVFGVPHDVVGTPGVVEEVEVDAFLELRLLAREVERGLDAERDQWGVRREDG